MNKKDRRWQANKYYYLTENTISEACDRVMNMEKVSVFLLSK
jgi:hypothetical protein